MTRKDAEAYYDKLTDEQKGRFNQIVFEQQQAGKTQSKAYDHAKSELDKDTEANDNGKN